MWKERKNNVEVYKERESERIAEYVKREKFSKI